MFPRRFKFSLFFIVLIAFLLCFTLFVSNGTIDSGASSFDTAINSVSRPKDDTHSFFAFFSSFFKKHETRTITLPDTIAYKNVADLDIDEVRRKASLIALPYSNDDEREEVLARLAETEALFDEWITITEKNIAKAESDGTKNREEIEEAREALKEMRKGRGFIAQRIQMVENDSLQ